MYIGQLVRIVKPPSLRIIDGLCFVEYEKLPDEDDDIFVGIVYFDMEAHIHKKTSVYNWRLNAV